MKKYVDEKVSNNVQYLDQRKELVYMSLTELALL